MYKYKELCINYPLDDDHKIEISKKFLERYGRQKDRIDWQEQRIETMQEISVGGSPGADKVRVQTSNLSDMTADTAIRISEITDAAKSELREERARLVDLYAEITGALALLEPDDRDLLYDVYIRGMDVILSQRLVHPKTAQRRHKRALIALYDRLSEQNKNGA